ncbi:MAG: DUF6596 domain-containing protein [Opitutus sp.]
MNARLNVRRRPLQIKRSTANMIKDGPAKYRRNENGSFEPQALLALMLLSDARRATRTDVHGDIVLLAEQNRALWDQTKIAEGIKLV